MEEPLTKIQVIEFVEEYIVHTAKALPFGVIARGFYFTRNVRPVQFAENAKCDESGLRSLFI